MEESVEPDSAGTAVEVIREELRHAVLEERKYHRESELNKNRLALGEIQDGKHSWDSNLVVAKAKELKKKPLSINDYLGLQSALIQDSENIDNFLKVDNVLAALVRDLSGTNPAIQLVSANCCCNIALANCKACTALAKTAGPYLVAELDTLNYPLVEVCAWTIGNLSGGSETAFQALYAQGCLKRLHGLLSDGDTSILPAVVYAVKHCLRTGHAIVPDSEMVELAKTVIHSLHFNEPDILWLLALLSSREACTDILCTILPMVFDNLSAILEANVPCVGQVSAAIRLFGNTVSEPTGAAADAILQNPNERVVKFFDKLLSHPSIDVRKEIHWMIGNLYCHSLPRISLRTREIVPLLLPHLQQAASSLRNSAIE